MPPVILLSFHRRADRAAAERRQDRPRVSGRARVEPQSHAYWVFLLHGREGWRRAGLWMWTHLGLSPRPAVSR